MIIGILKEIKTEENRVSMTPAGVEVMIQNGHALLVEKDAGQGSGFEDVIYKEAGAEVVATPQEIFERAEMVMHVKEPLPAEYGLIREDQIVFTYLHLAAAEELTHALIKSKSINIAYETIQKADGSLPLLTPMSAVAKTSTIALTNATLPYAVQIANKGWRRAMRENPEIKLGANVMNGKVTYQAVAEAFGLEHTPIETLL